MRKYLPSDIKNPALRSVYYTVQKIIANRYECDLARVTDKDTKRALKERFNSDIRELICYYVELSR